jgi:hypothetical protein
MHAARHTENRRLWLSWGSVLLGAMLSSDFSAHQRDNAGSAIAGVVAADFYRSWDPRLPAPIAGSSGPASGRSELTPLLYLRTPELYGG